MKHPLFYQTYATWLLERDLTGFDPRKIPMTEAKRDMINASKESWQLFFEEYIHMFGNGDG